MFKNVNIYYRVTIISICIILLNQFFIQYFLHQKKSDAEIINIGGKQRMISQRLLVLGLLELESSDKGRQSDIDHLYKQWLEAHEFLKEKFAPKGFYGDFQLGIQSQLDGLDVFIIKSKNFISKNVVLSEVDKEAFRKNQDSFLFRMNNIVSAIEVHSSEKLQTVIWVEILFALISLFMIYYEITFIFKKINNNLDNKNKALEDSNHMLEQYAYLAAHDLRSPTQNIINFTKLLKRKLETKMDDKEKTYFSFIYDAAQRMNETTEELLKFASINHDTIEITPCQPKKILDNVIQDLKPKIEERKAQIKIGELPDAIQADQQLIHLVFQNLIANGIKFVQKDKTPELTINYSSQQKKHVFHVQDNGIGINSDNQKKIFGLFKRLHNQQEFKGTGIGLSICQKIVEKHNGMISVESEVNEGSTFTFSLPKNMRN